MNLQIRPMERTDISALHSLLSDEAVMRYIEPPFTLEQTKAFLEEAGLGAEPLIYAVEDENKEFLSKGIPRVCRYPAVLWNPFHLRSDHLDTAEQQALQ